MAHHFTLSIESPPHASLRTLCFMLHLFTPASTPGSPSSSSSSSSSSITGLHLRDRMAAGLGLMRGGNGGGNGGAGLMPLDPAVTLAREELQFFFSEGYLVSAEGGREGGTPACV